MAWSYHFRMHGKQRLSATVDADLLEAAEQAVRSGRAKNVSVWVNEALRLKLEHDRRLEALAGFIEAYEADHGDITPDEVRSATRRAGARAVTVRPRPARKKR